MKGRFIGMIYYVADLHFGHQSVIKFDNRPFSSVEEMDRILIELWNKKVSNKDLVYVVGDFAYRNTKPFEWYLKQLKGKKYLIIGNHDDKFLEAAAAMSYFEGVDKMCHVRDDGRNICVCHYPLAEWNGMYHGTYHVYGHIHNSTNVTFQFMRTLDKALNCGVAINSYAPVTLKELEKNNFVFKQSVEKIEL